MRIFYSINDLKGKIEMNKDKNICARDNELIYDDSVCYGLLYTVPV